MCVLPTIMPTIIALNVFLNSSFLVKLIVYFMFPVLWAGFILHIIYVYVVALALTDINFQYLMF